MLCRDSVIPRHIHERASLWNGSDKYRDWLSNRRLRQTVGVIYGACVAECCGAVPGTVFSMRSPIMFAPRC